MFQKSRFFINQSIVTLAILFAQISLFAQTSTFDPEKDLIQPIVNTKVTGYTPGDVLQSSSQKLANVNTPTHTALEYSYDDTGLKVRFLYDDVALKKPEMLLKDLEMLSMLGMKGVSSFFSQSGFLDPAMTLELIQNAKAGSLAAQARLAEIELRTLRQTDFYPLLKNLIPNANQYMQETIARLTQDLPRLQKAARLDQANREKELERWRKETGALEKWEAMPEKLNDLILNNDRKAVADMIRAYLPWPVMEPVEARFWKTWLEAIEHPDSSKTRIAFRGVDYDTDKIQRKMTEKGEVYGFMSTMLTKNQGSYTRRLRSLSTNRLKNGASPGVEESNIPVVRILEQFFAHAINPQSSSFLSFTYSPAIARGYGKNATEPKKVNGKTKEVPLGGLLIVNVDARRMVPNMVSGYYDLEMELLAPLVIFPDEIVAYKEGSFRDVEERSNFIKLAIQDLPNNPIEKGILSGAEDVDAIKLREVYSKDSFEFLKPVMIPTSTGVNKCSQVFQ